MNIENLIRAANPVRTSDLDGGDSPRARRVLARILQDSARSTAPNSAMGPGFDRGRAAAGRGRRHRRKRTLLTIGLAAAAAGATAAGLLLAVPGAAQHPLHGPAPAPGAHPSTAQLATARQVLLTAAANVASTPTTGRYWEIQAVTGINIPGGTKAHPYDITLANSYTEWNPSSAAQKLRTVTQQLGIRPATPADAAAWRAAGSPSSWISGEWPTASNNGFSNGPHWWPVDGTTAASVPSASWAASDGTVGYVEGDEAGLNAAQFRQMPTSPAGVAAMLRHYYEALPLCAKHPSQCSPEDQILWSEALALLQDPVSAQVRSATFKVMAAMPGVKLLGPMTDPLGRRGYGIFGGQEHPANSGLNEQNTVLIDPNTGELLATELIGPIPRSLQCEAVIYGKTAGHGKVVINLGTAAKPILDTCIGPSFVGPSYQNQVDSFTVLVSQGWTNATQALPAGSAWHHDSGEIPALPPDMPLADAPPHPPAP